MERVICFDLWHTLVEPRGGRVTYPDVFVRLGAQRDAIYPIVRDHLMGCRFEYDTMCNVLCSWLDLQGSVSDINEAARRWKRDNDSASWIPGAVTTLESLRIPGHRLVLVTNITAPAWRTVGRNLQLIGEPSSFFDCAFASCLSGICKPSVRIWKTIEGWFPNADEFYMIGDNEAEDVAVPRERGWKTILVNERSGIPIAAVPNIIMGGEYP